MFVIVVKAFNNTVAQLGNGCTESCCSKHLDRI